MKLLVTGGAGFIGSAFVRMMIGAGCARELLVLDKLTYAGNLENLAPVAGDPRYRFVRGDICDATLVEHLLEEFRPDAIVHFAAESHVDRSILSPAPVFETNLRGTFVLLEAARKHGLGVFLHVSTDEVYGSLPEPLEADENFPLRPSSPYSASKAGADLLVLSYFTTYRVPVIVTRASNNYGPYQFPEKLIPLMIGHAMEDRPLPVYGDGGNVRDWLYVEDHCRALALLLEKGRTGEIYNVGGNCALPNLEVVRRILRITGKPESLIRFVADRPGHDRRYAISSRKIQQEIGWRPETDFEEGLRRTVAWYRENAGWVARVLSGEYRRYYEQNYLNREAEIRRLVRS
ncbi:MAG: dTDP-glucose 4,6-dehydratase [Bryobacterales bacterium]|nr:dTDP-glucose 4,6-dehydratase [Bryobacteraceae bacterium]MDW8131017.1 dTDP-glucose 4,6-dehydratase [Bryobacterales bacterium]